MLIIFVRRGHARPHARTHARTQQISYWHSASTWKCLSVKWLCKELK